ncbi:MAG: hypothetical protein SWQ30_09710 [Thermodesulfobacteriota bacterium]|nr:hypothetical protein [Thermodesulfobacteriota bacterium]
MKVRRKAQTKLMAALAAAYREKAKIEVDGQWEVGVMRHIRRLGPVHSGGISFEFLERYMWQLASATCLLILILSAALIRGEFIPEYEIAQAFIEEPTRLSLMAFLTP